MEIISSEKILLSEDEQREFDEFNLKFIKEDPILQENKQYVVIRHAFSLFNYEYLLFMRKNPGVNFNDPIYRELRLKKELEDPPLHQYGEVQALVASEFVNKIPFSLIFCSPMRRALQTTKLLFQDYQKINGTQLKVMVFPLLSEAIKTSNDIASRTLTTVKEEFKNVDHLDYDFTLVEKFQDLKSWQVLNISNEEVIKQLNKNLDKYKELQEIGVLQGFLDTLDEVYPNCFEEAQQTFDRSNKAQNEIKEYIRSYDSELKQSSQIAIVSHLSFIKCFLSKVDENGNTVTPNDVENCEPKFIEF